MSAARQRSVWQAAAIPGAAVTWPPEERAASTDDRDEVHAYYERVAAVLVLQLRDRPFTMKRCREEMPSWIPRRRFETHPREGGSRLVDSRLVNSKEPSFGCCRCTAST
jgi:DNA primase